MIQVTLRSKKVKFILSNVCFIIKVYHNIIIINHNTQENVPL